MDSAKISISKASTADIDQLELISCKTFYEAFASENTEDDMQKYLEESFNQQKLLKELNNNTSAFYFISIEDKKVGYLKVNSSAGQSELKTDNSLEIERIYILQEFQGQRLGQALVDKAIEIARKMACDFVWLGVWEKNLKAIEFYKRNGFVEFDKHVFVLGNDVQTDLMMKRELNAI
ncbi:GNAT family N-acetyltransferase [Solitalea longa]|uniref:GNAT family N-acetyltransferase n=1 Tax=Solitalea longa TaxID=2079460 RepID=A0A2S5A073_9SPHI|nr:GNAT family N-acetyltransferase [Solitalea longa]POY35945.1 GNAT family N-acetyltransferase [Solitalea longa]